MGLREYVKGDKSVTGKLMSACVDYIEHYKIDTCTSDLEHIQRIFQYVPIGVLDELRKEHVDIITRAYFVGRKVQSDLVSTTLQKLP